MLGLLFVVIPVVEVWLLFRLSTWVGFGPTLLLSILTGVWGAALARREGLRAWRQISESLERMEAPERALFEAALILVGGVLLITPGILTDCVGFLLLVPVTRGALAGLAAHLAGAHVGKDHRPPPAFRVVQRPSARPPEWASRPSAGFGAGAGQVIETTGESVE